MGLRQLQLRLWQGLGPITDTQIIHRFDQIDPIWMMGKLARSRLLHQPIHSSSCCQHKQYDRAGRQPQCNGRSAHFDFKKTNRLQLSIAFRKAHWPVSRIRGSSRPKVLLRIVDGFLCSSKQMRCRADPPTSDHLLRDVGLDESPSGTRSLESEGCY